MIDATKLLGGLLKGGLSGGGAGGLLGGGSGGGLTDIAGSLLGGGSSTTSGSGGGSGMGGLIGGGIAGALIAGAVAHFAGKSQEQEAPQAAAAMAPPPPPASVKGVAPAGGMKGSGKTAPPPPPAAAAKTVTPPPPVGGKTAPASSVKAAPSGKAAPGGVKGQDLSSQAKGPSDQAQREAVLLLKAMIASASADGVIDAQERQTIMGELERAGLTPEERSFLDKEFASPASLKEIASEAAGAGKAKEAYIVSLVAVSVDAPAERNYLVGLAGALGLPMNEVQDIHKQFGRPAL